MTLGRFMTGCGQHRERRISFADVHRSGDVPQNHPMPARRPLGRRLYSPPRRTDRPYHVRLHQSQCKCHCTLNLLRVAARYSYAPVVVRCKCCVVPRTYARSIEIERVRLYGRRYIRKKEMKALVDLSRIKNVILHKDTYKNARGEDSSRVTS